MVRLRSLLFIVAAALVVGGVVFQEPLKELTRPLTTAYGPGDAIDSLHGVTVYHNDGYGSIHGRNVVDG